MQISERLLTLIVFTVAALSGCGGGGGGGGTPTPPVADEAVGGIWVGTDSTGLEIFALSTECGEMHWVIPVTGEQGFGSGSSNGTSVSFNYTYVAPLGFVLSDGSTSATCTATGTIQERQSLDVDVSCTTTEGNSFDNSARLAYSNLYDRDSSLATIAGNYDDFGLTLNVNGAGEIFEQDPGSGCVVNGQVSVIDARYNAYDIWIQYSNCQGDFAILNGARFDGLGTLDNTVNPEMAIAGLVGDVGGITYSVIYALPRL